MNQPIHQFTFLKLRFVPFVVGLLMTGLLINNFQVLAQIPEDKQRYVGLQLLNLDPKPQYGLDIIENSIRQGCNLVEISIYWDEVYKKVNDQPFWEQSDRQMELISRLGAKAAIRIMLGRKLERLEGFWTEKETMKDFLGRPLSSAYGRTCFSFAHPPTVNKAFGFVQEVLRRYNTYQQQGKLLFVTFVNTPTQELGYHYETDPDGVYEKRYTTAFDYSQPSTDAFVDWLTAKYKRVNKLNYLWGTQFATFRDVRTPNTSYFPLPAYRTRGGKDWYLFMHLLLKEYIQKGIKVIKEVNPNFKVVSEYGAVCDVKSAIRGTIAFRDLDQNTDGTKVHDDLYYNHRFIADVVRTNRPGKWVMNEVFYTNDSPVDLLIRHFDESFENGCQVVVMVVSTVEENARRVFENVSRWKNIPYQEVVPTVSMTYKVTEVLDSTITLFEKKWKEIVPKSGLPTVAVKLEEDILTDEYWKPLTVNVHPVVVNPIPERASKVRRQFSYTLPRDVFKDPDGDIVRIEVIEKPAWLNFNGSVFSGTTPDQVAEHRITLRATDDEGATVTTSFTLRVTNVNIKPIVRRPLPDFEGFLEQYLYYQLQGDHFDDPDGTIVRIQAVAGLRPWMTFNGREFGAFPKEQGTFTVTLRATDDDSAWVETSFKVKIINRSPIVRTPLPEKIIAQNKAFRFRIPANTFSDPDGEIVRLRVFNLPTWLTFDGNELRGTPTDLGTYRLIVRAYDNGGDSTQTPFVIKVDERNVVNMPPIVRFKIPNQALFVTQKFSYKIPDSLFFDTNGYIERIETPNLPAWLTFRNNQISGTATLPGKYTVTLKAIDDDEAATTTSFEIEVRYANIRFELIQAGKAGSRRLLSELKNGDVLLESNLPASVTIYAHCELPAQRLDFRLSGPYQKQITVSRFPFALFDEETGFVPIAGSYTLEAIAYNDSLAVSATKINFNVKTSQPLGDWQAYPNPFDGVCNVKLPDATDETSLSYRLVLPTGQAISISLSNVTIVEKVAYFNFSTMSLPTGTLFLEIYQQQQLQKILKIVKQ